MKKNKNESMLHFRCSMFYDILCLMERKNDSTLPNKYRVAKVIMEYYRKEGFRNDLALLGYVWQPSVKYIVKHMKTVSRIANENGHPYDFYRSEKYSFNGLWMFLKKKEYVEIIKRERKEINSRIKTSNNKLEDANELLGYNLQLAPIPEVSLIETNPKRKLLK